MLYLCRKNASFCLGRPEFRFNCVSKSPKFGWGDHNLFSEFEHFREQNPLNHRFFSALHEFESRENHRTVSISVLVRSIVSIIRKTDNWDSLLNRLCVVSSSQITPRIAVQVIKRIRKPDTAFKFFEWLDDCDGFTHDSLTYSAVLQVLAKDSHPSHASIADDLLHKKIDLGLDVSPTDFEFVLQQWVKVRKPEKALGLLDEMKCRGFVPSCSSCNVLLRGLFKSKQTNLGLELFHQMRDGWIEAVDTQSFNSVMKIACVQGRTEEALGILNSMKEKDCVPDLDSFNILIKGFSEKGDANRICSLFKQMLDIKLKPDSYTMNLLIKELCKQGRPECGNDLFNHMRKVGWIDKKFVYTQLVDSLCNYGWWLKGLKIFVKMVRRGHHPNVSLYNNIVRRLCMGGRVRQAYRLKELMAKKGFISDIEIYSALMEGVCLAGRMDMADKLFKEIRHKGLEPDLRMWNALLHGYCIMKDATKAMGIVEKMKEIGMAPELGPCNDLVNNLMIEEKVEEAMLVKNCIQGFQDKKVDVEASSIELNHLDDVGVKEASTE